MRLWPPELFPTLPDNQIRGQWKEVVQMLYGFWGKKHSTVDWCWKYGRLRLMQYAFKVYLEMQRRGFNARGWFYLAPLNYDGMEWEPYPEFNQSYLQSCIENLRQKGVVIDVSAVSA